MAKGGMAMDIKSTRVFDSDEPVSKALGEVVRAGTTVVVMKGKAYQGIIDDRNIRLGLADVSKTKCDTVCVKAPFLYPTSSILDRVHAFMAGHFKALPVFEERNNKLLGLSTRIELINDLLTFNAIPKKAVAELMNSPVYTIGIHASVGEVKSAMKEYNARHLVVMDKDQPVGVLSTLDLALVFTEPKGRAGEQFIKEIWRPDHHRISDFLRPDLVTIDAGASLQEAAQKMVQNDSAHILVLLRKKPAGVLTAVDLFKEVMALSRDERPLVISGLGEDDLASYDYIKDTIGEKLAKFSKSFSLTDVSVHAKRGKSVYHLNLSLTADKEHIVVSSEEYDLQTAVDRVVDELTTVLSKKKSMKKLLKKREREEP